MSSKVGSRAKPNRAASSAAEDDEPSTVAGYLADERLASRDAFLARFTCPVLLHDGSPASDERCFATLHAHDEAATVRLATRPEEVRGLRVWHVRKRPGGLYSNLITLGRALSHDMVIAHAKISKFHAYFTSSDGGYHLTDAGSTNGTTVNGAALEARVATPILDGALLGFWQFPFRFYTPCGFHELLRSLLGEGRR